VLLIIAFFLGGVNDQGRDAAPHNSESHRRPTSIASSYARERRPVGVQAGAGHDRSRWISAVVEDVAPEEGMRRLSEAPYADAMREAQETVDRELSGREHVEASPPLTH
jgi:hypothetical protein